MKRGKLIASLLWQGLMGFVSPVWIGFSFMCITGHSKGYGYDLRDETFVSIILGIIFYLFWIVSVIPVFVRLEKFYYKKKKSLAALPVLLFIGCFIITVLIIGIKDFISFFGPIQ